MQFLSLGNKLNLNILFWLSVAYQLNAHGAVQAQVIKDGTTSTEVTTENNRDFTVNSGEQREGNLFHSFSQFSIPNNGAVFFNNPATIQNIITRVTGSSVSELNGLIRSNGSANLFLLNPNGIIFGENATLDIGGSFIGTTAESLLFTDGTEFSTDLNASADSLLTVSVPLGLQFGSNSGEIINQANFSVPNPFDPTGQDQVKLGLTTPSGKTLALIGKGITFAGGAATAPQGNIQLGSVGDNSFVALEPVATGWQANYENVRQFQDLKFTNLASVDTSGTGSGEIKITGKNIQVLSGSAITANTLGNLDGKTIEIQASELLEIKGSDVTDTKVDPLLATTQIFLPFASQISSNTFAEGKGGDINLKARNLQLLDGGKIELQTLFDSTGKAGDLDLLVEESINLAGNRSLLQVGTNARDFLLPTITLDNAIEFNQASSIGSRSLGVADGGNITISAENIRLEDGSSIGVTPLSSGNGGDIQIKARSLEVTGISSRTGSTSSAVISSTLADGTSGNLEINTRQLTVTDGGQIISSTNAIGDAGNIEINAAVTKIRGFRPQDGVPSSIAARAIGTGNGGDIALSTEQLIISDRGSLSVQGEGASVPGNLMVKANTVELNNSASITAGTEFQSGGNIQLEILDRLTLQENSRISAQAFENANGGNLNIDARFIVAYPQENNDIVANAVFGRGGNIAINTQGIFGIEERRSIPINLSNDLDASSQSGSEGRVSIFFPSFTKIEGSLKPPTTNVDVEYLLKNTFCKVRNGNNSKFVATGRNGIPLIPDSAVVPDHTWSDWRILAAKKTNQNQEVENTAKTSVPPKIVMVQGWVTDRQGNIILTNGHPQAYAERYPLGPSFYKSASPGVSPGVYDGRGGVRVTDKPPVTASHEPIVNTPDCHHSINNN